MLIEFIDITKVAIRWGGVILSVGFSTDIKLIHVGLSYLRLGQIGQGRVWSGQFECRFFFRSRVDSSRILGCLVSGQGRLVG
jgi:hypothetical protein